MNIPLTYLCYQATTHIEIDGDLTKPVWQNAPWTETFVDIEGDRKPLPTFQTRVKMLWDDTYFYIGAELEEPHIWGTLTEHDSVIFYDNDFEVFIDPDGDNHDYYEIEINALNTTWDLRLVKPYRDGGPALNEWEVPGMKTAVKIDGTLNDSRDTDQGWSVELALPWSVLGEFARNHTAPPQNGDQWRINFSRVQWDISLTDEGGYQKIPNRPEHNWVWSPQGLIDMHQPEHWGYVQFTTALPDEATFTPDPSLPARQYLMQIYHAQRAHHKQTGEWASNLSTLNVPIPTQGVTNPQLKQTADGFEASAKYLPSRRLFVRTDSLLWED